MASTTLRPASLAILFVLAAPAAQAASVKEIFEKHGLIGAFALDCAQPAGPQNIYVVHRPLAAGHVQRDTMSGEATRIDASVVDSASEPRPGQVAMSVANEQRRLEQVLGVEPTRWRVIEITDGGRKLVSEGRTTDAARVEMPWFNKCG